MSFFYIGEARDVDNSRSLKKKLLMTAKRTLTHQHLRVYTKSPPSTFKFKHNAKGVDRNLFCVWTRCGNFTTCPPTKACNSYWSRHLSGYCWPSGI